MKSIQTERSCKVKQRPYLVLGTVAICLCLVAAAAPQKVKLPEHYQKWLDEEVAHIIVPLEREVFLKLTTDRERDLFIDAFWKHRDPMPNTPENEFKIEHYRRINYANRYYGRSAPIPGWRTDRGRMYIILGEPNDIQRFDGTQGIYPCQVWFYQGKNELGLPNGFYLLFWQEGGMGDFKLYSPVKDGPQALLTAYVGDPTDYLTAFEKLQDIAPTLAERSMSLIEGDSSLGMGRPTLSSELLLQKIENVPSKQVEEKYARKFLEYKDSVEVEYSANYLDSDAIIKIAKEPAGIYFVHYAIEPKRLSVNAYNDKYSTTLKINGIVSALDGKMVFQFDRTATVKIDEAQMKLANQQPFDFHDMFPLIPGTYKVSIIWKNEVSKEFSSLEQTLVIPGDTPALQMTSPFLGYMIARRDAAKKRLKPFQFGGVQVYGQPGRVFSKKDTLTVAFQLFGLTPAQKQSGVIRYAFTRNDQPAFDRTRAVREYQEWPNILEEFPLADVIPSHYGLKVAFVMDGRELVAATEEFDVSHQDALPRPWFYSQLMPEASDPNYGQQLGNQLFHVGRITDARRYLENAHRQMPNSPDAALDLSRLYLAINEPANVPPVLSPFLGTTPSPKYELFILTGEAYQKLGDFSKAVDILDGAVARYGVNAELLNAIGDCYAKMGKPKEALAAWEKSLQLNPAQPDIKKKADAARDKK
jgi:GWxTD domain-containing protein